MFWLLIELESEQLKQIIDKERNFAAQTISFEFNICQKTIINTVKCIILMFKFNHQLPHKLAVENKHKRKNCCLALLRGQKKKNVLDRIVICDEKWVYYYSTSHKGGWSASGESAGYVARHVLTRRCFSASSMIVMDFCSEST